MPAIQTPRHAPLQGKEGDQVVDNTAPCALEGWEGERAGKWRERTNGFGFLEICLCLLGSLRRCFLLLAQRNAVAQLLRELEARERVDETSEAELAKVLKRPLCFCPVVVGRQRQPLEEGGEVVGRLHSIIRRVHLKLRRLTHHRF